MRIKAFFILASTAWVASAHYTWVAPGSGKIMIAHGHRFPQSEEAINATQIKAWAVAPSGTRTDLRAVAAPGVVQADFTPKEKGPHRLVFTQDRGLMSRTPRGVKAGGKDKNPDATETFRILRTGVAYPAPLQSPKPLGLEVELVAELANGKWIVQLLKEGKPLAGQVVQVVLKDHKDATDAGKTGADGRVTYAAPAGTASPMLFVAEFNQGENRYSASLYLSW